MAITLNVNRPKLTSTVPVTANVISKAVIENADNFEIPLCFDNISGTPVTLTDISFEGGTPTVIGLAPELAKVKVGSVLVTAGTTSDFASGTYVTAKPSATTLTVSTNALQSQEGTTGTATLTLDATACILRIKPVVSGSSVRFDFSASRFDGSLATDSNGNGYDEVAYSNGSPQTLSSITVDFDAFATNIGLVRVNED
jgi:hypothetical protein